MPKPPRPWIVTPHQPLRRVDENLWEIDGAVPGFPPAVDFTRRMSIVRRSDGKLLFFNAVPVDDATLGEIRALGEPALLLVPHHLHCMDGRAFAEKLGLAVYTAAVSLDKTAAIVPGARPLEELPPDPTLSIVPLPSSRFGEVGVVVHTGTRASLLVCDLVTNVQRARGLVGGIFRLLGFIGPDPRLPAPVRMRAFPDKAKVKADLERLAAIPGLCRLVPSHGPIVEDDVPGTLRRVAARV